MSTTKGGAQLAAETPTPRTDKEWDDNGVVAKFRGLSEAAVKRDFARQLERELKQAKKNYYDVADALCRESTGPEDLCRQARELREQLATERAAREETRKAYQTTKDWAHRLEANLQTLVARCDEHADGTKDATPLEQFANELIGLCNEISLNEARTLKARAEAAEAKAGDVAKLREALEPLAEIARIHELYEGPPCNNKRHSDDWEIAHTAHGKGESHTLTLGHCRAAAAALASVPAEKTDGNPPQVDATLEQLVCELLAMLETTEESDAGRVFHPTTIQTCRCADAAKLDELMPKLKAAVKQAMELAADAAAPGLEDELADALRHTTLCTEKVQCNLCRDANNLLTKYDNNARKEGK